MFKTVKADHLIFVVDHVSESLIVDNSDENIDVHLATVSSTVHTLSAVEVVADCNSMYR